MRKGDRAKPELRGFEAYLTARRVGTVIGGYVSTVRTALRRLGLDPSTITPLALGVYADNEFAPTSRARFAAAWGYFCEYMVTRDIVVAALPARQSRQTNAGASEADARYMAVLRHVSPSVLMLDVPRLRWSDLNLTTGKLRDPGTRAWFRLRGDPVEYTAAFAALSNWCGAGLPATPDQPLFATAPGSMVPVCAAFVGRLRTVIEQLPADAATTAIPTATEEHPAIVAWKAYYEDRMYADPAATLVTVWRSAPAELLAALPEDYRAGRETAVTRLAVKEVSR